MVIICYNSIEETGGVYDMNNQNLIPMTERTKNEQREITKKGGIASGKARREKKQLKEELLFLLNTDNTASKISVALINEAIKGNVRAFEVIRDTIGEKPTDKQEILSSNLQININREPMELEI